MSVHSSATEPLKEGEYLLNDPVLLDNMRLSRDIRVPASAAILVAQYTPITATLLERLNNRNIKTLFAEPILEKTVAASVKQMDKMFGVLDEVLSEMAHDMEDAATAFQNRQEMQQLEQLIRENLKDIEQLFHTNPTEKLVALTKYHNGTARHSIIASFHMMAIGRELGWNDNKIVKAALAVINHDVGKTKIKLETLDWPGRLNSEQWKEIQHHPLFGGRLLLRKGKPPDMLMLVALLHHEWYATVEGKGYGGLTLFSDYIQRNWKLDIPNIVRALDEDDREIIQTSSLVDMVSALEESRAYKRELDSFKVLIIMNSDARMGHFNPKQYAAWHRLYMRQNPKLLPVGRRMALPREKEHRHFSPLPPKPMPPTPFLTYHEMVQLGFLPILQNVGMDVERIHRRGGFSLKVLEQLNLEKNLNLDLSPSLFRSHGIHLLKTEVIQEEQIIQLEAWREWFTVEELEKSGLLYRAKMKQFNMDLIHTNNGISPERLLKRGLSVPKSKLDRLGITLLKEWPVTLPGSENRLTAEDLKKLGITETTLQQAGCLERVNKIKSGVPMTWLEQQGIAISRADLARHNIDPVRKIFYDIQVVEEIDTSKAKFRIMREGDDPKALDLLHASGDLGPIQNILFNTVGEIIMDFSDLITLPDLSHLTLGNHW